MNRNAYAVLIGSNTYTDRDLSDLRYAEKDCDDLYNVLTDKKMGVFPKGNVIKLLGEEATTDNVEKLLFKHIVCDRSPEDMVLVYISGHGFVMPDLEKTYLATYDVSKITLSNNPRKGLHTDYLHEEIFKKSKAGKVVLLMDTCHSGAIVPSSIRGANSRLFIDEHYYSTGSGRIAIVSCPHDVQSRESDSFKNGVFTHYLLKGLRGEAVEPATREITIDSLLAYVRQHAPAEQPPVRYGQDCGRVVLAKSINMQKEFNTYSLYSHKKFIDGAKHPEFVPLKNRIEPYKPFIDKLTELLGEDSRLASYDTETRILEAVRLASKAEFVFLMRVDRDGLLTKSASNLSSKGKNKNKYIDDIITNLLPGVISNGDIFSSDFKGLFTTDNKNKNTPKIHVAFPIRKKPPCEFMVICGLPNKSYFLDEPYAEILSALYSASQSMISVNALQIEASILDQLRLNHGFMPASFYNRRFDLFKNRLNQMIIHFQPILYLDRRAPHICGYEALARDPKNLKAPVDLFKAAELWGRQFIIELDSYFLQLAVNTYGSVLTGTRREGILDLSVNVYPDTLLQKPYCYALTDIVKKEIIPPNKLLLEISEKFPLPSPVSIENSGGIPIMCSFKDILEQYVSNLGIGFGIDDFGVGHASLSRLIDLHPNYVKIDQEILNHESVYEALRYTFSLTKSLTSKYLTCCKFVIEGYDSSVNRKVMLHKLYEMGIRYIQGHIYGDSGPGLFRLDKDMKKYLQKLIEGDRSTLQKDNAINPKANQRRLWPGAISGR